MTWETTEGVFKILFDPLFTTAIAGLLLLLGVTLRKKLTFLTRFCIPAAVLGGLTMSLIILAMYHHGGASIQFTTSMQSPMMIAFFTTVGIGGSLALLKRGGLALVIYLVFCWLLAAFQNGFGVSLAKLFNLHPVLGVMAGAVSLEGGHGAAAAFGPTAESLGVVGAKAVAIASATYGLIAGGLLGGPIASWLINKNKLEIAASQDALYKQRDEDATSQSMDSVDFIKMFTLVLVIMSLGSWVSVWFNGMAKNVWKWENFSLPGYVGAMFVAVIFRNINDILKLVKINDRAIEIISDLTIGIFLTMAMMSLKIWELYSLALPLTAILVLQTVAIVFLAVFLLFPLLGKDYDAAVICSGLIGHGLGATPNAVSNMGAVCERYKVMSYKAFLIVPLCGAVLIDLVGIPNIVWFINYFSK